MRCARKGIPPPEHHFLLDFGRAVAAAAVMFSHFSHFSHYPGSNVAPTAASLQPLHAFLWPLYDYGGVAVQFFFVLSGFIFFNLYYDAIHMERISPYKFLVLRLSRLYPLHLITLLFVAVAQWVTYASFREFFIYKDNDYYHFILQLFFASSWGLQESHSFNGPIWSVSLEVLAYVSFFLIAFVIRKNIVWTVGLVVLSFFLMRKIAFEIGMVLACFFIGGLVSQVIDLLSRVCSKSQFGLLAGCAATGSAISCVALTLIPELAIIRNEIVFGFVFPALVFCLAGAQYVLPLAGRRISRVGELTYATYLLHFPVQLVLAPIFFVELGLHHPSLFLLFAYFGMTVVLAYYTYHWFERPAQRFLRSHMLETRYRRDASNAKNLTPLRGGEVNHLRLDPTHDDCSPASSAQTIAMTATRRVSEGD